MKVLIKKTNKIEEVKDNYATSFLIPKGLAVVATADLIAKHKKHQQQINQNLELKDKARKELAKQLEGKVYIYKAKANDKGELYASVNKQQIKKLLQIKDKVSYKLKEPLKRLGKYNLDLKIGKYRTQVVIDIQNK